MMTALSIGAAAGLISGATLEAIGLALKCRRISKAGLQALQMLKPHYTEEELREIEENLSPAATMDFKGGAW